MSKKRMKKFTALVGTIAATTMLIIFFLAMPAFLATTGGKVFSVSWLLISLISLAGFSYSLFKGTRKKRTFAPVRGQAASVQQISEWDKRGRQRASSL